VTAEEQIKALEERILRLERIVMGQRRRKQEERRTRPGPSRPGPAELAVNRWAREQTAQGKTVDDLLPEYIQRRGLDAVTARELLRKAVRGKKPL
jgi:hypothetical protein